MSEVVWLLSVLIGQGVAYKRIVEGEDIKGIGAEELEVVLGVADLSALKDKIMGAMLSGIEREVEVEEKNAMTTQDK